MIYTDEHTFFAQIAHACILLAFVSALLSAAFFYLELKNPAKSLLAKNKLHAISSASCSYYVHSFSVVFACFCLLWAFYAQYFEIDYIWKHSSKIMPIKYILSAFWGGQQGSLLLWVFWQSILGLFLMRFNRYQPKESMFLYSLFQAFLVSMLLGVYVGYGENWFKIGNSPFTLIRELPQNADLFWTFVPDYLQKVAAFSDGQGLNPLLQNYWMTIHPPIIFLGFALTMVPFILALLTLWLGQNKRENIQNTRWLKFAIPWTFAAIGVLGLGILLGGAWAYESLSFGGFWAWDPVENAILIPWLVLLAAGHLMLIAKHRQRHFFSTFLFTLLSFILVIYSTFLTRSGILGESSVHSFAGEGMMNQLIIFQVFSIAIAVYFLLGSKKSARFFLLFSFLSYVVYLFLPDLLFFKLPKTAFFLAILFVFISYILLKARNAYFMPKQAEAEEDIYSREFWLFLGALFVIVSAFIIAFVTSIPLWNKILGTQYDAFTDLSLRHQFYNPWVAFCFIFVLFAMGIAQILKYKKTPKTKTVHQKILLYGLVSFVLALGAYGRFLYFSSDAVQKVEYVYFALFMAAVFALLLQWNPSVFLKKRKQIGSALAHVGFSVFLIGVIVSMGQQKVISANQSAVSVQTIDKDFKNNRNIILQKKDTLVMGDYKVVYQDKKFRDAIHIDYQVDYFAKETGDFLFSLYPFVQMNPKFGNVAEPGTAHFWNKDVFTYLKYADFQVAATDTALIDIHQDKMSWRKLVYQPLHQIEVKQNDSTHFYFSKTAENSIPDFIIYAGELLPLSLEEKQSKNIPAEDVAAVLPLVFSMPQYPDRPYTVRPSIHISAGKQPQILFSKETIPDLGYEIQMDAKVLNENFVSLRLRDTKPFLYNGYSFYFSPLRLIDSAQEKEKLGFFASDEVYQMPLRFTSAKNTNTYQETLSYAVSAQGDVLPNILSIPDINLDLMIQGFGTEGNIVLLLREKEFLVMEAIEFPAMLLVWFGAFLCFMGVAWSVLKKIFKK